MKITIENLEFTLSVKDKITKIPKISKLHLDFISGKNIHFDKTNLSIKLSLIHISEPTRP